MVVVFSVNGALASYSIEYLDDAHVIALLTGNVENRRDLPEKIEFFHTAGIWSADTEYDGIKNPIIHALSHSRLPG